jgi:dienelactone hydrolase
MLNEKAKIANLHYLYADLPEEKAHKKASRRLSKFGYELDKKNTDKDVLTAKKGDNNIHINYSGTNIRNPRDIISDAALATGVQRLNPQFKERRQKTRDIMRQYGDNKDYTMSGHSLGGSIALNTVSQSKSIRDRVKKVDVFNPGYTLPFHNSIKVDKPIKRELDKKVTLHRTKGDIVSAYANKDTAFGAVAEYTNKDNNADLSDKHSLETFMKTDL